MNFLKRTLSGTLRTLAIFIVRKFEPGIVGVTGSVGKTSTKEAIATVLRSVRRVRASQESHNNEYGFPLGVLGAWAPRDLELVSKEEPPGVKRFAKMFFWIRVVLKSFFVVLFGNRSRYPEILVLEYGADRPGNIKYLTEIAKPQIAVVTAVGEIPVHVEFYNGPEAVAREKSRLVEHLPSNGFAILNADDDQVLAMRERTRAHILTFGFGPEAEIRVTNFEHRIEDGKPIGVSFKLEYGGSFVPVRIDGAFGRAVAYAAAAAAAVGIVFGVHLVRIAEALAYYQPPRHRMRLIPGLRGSLLIDDSYNASPLSVASAIETVKALPATRKVAILGDMLELGERSIDAHEAVGRSASKVFDILITVGSRGKLIGAAARERGMAARSILSFDTVETAAPEVERLLRKGDLVLIKASRGIGLDGIVRLVRQAQ